MSFRMLLMGSSSWAVEGALDAAVFVESLVELEEAKSPSALSSASEAADSVLVVEGEEEASADEVVGSSTLKLDDESVVVEAAVYELDESVEDSEDEVDDAEESEEEEEESEDDDPPCSPVMRPLSKFTSTAWAPPSTGGLPVSPTPPPTLEMISKAAALSMPSCLATANPTLGPVRS